MSGWVFLSAGLLVFPVGLIFMGQPIGSRVMRRDFISKRLSQIRTGLFQLFCSFSLFLKLFLRRWAAAEGRPGKGREKSFIQHTLTLASVICSGCDDGEDMGFRAGRMVDKGKQYGGSKGQMGMPGRKEVVAECFPFLLSPGYILLISQGM